MSNNEFNSEGFDLDAIPSGNGDKDEVVYEIGGVANSTSSQNTTTATTETKNHDQSSSSPIDKSEDFKRLGNEQFKAGNHLDAYDYYTDAIEACPGMKGSEILEQMEAHEEEEREKAYKQNSREAHRRRRVPPATAGDDSNNDNSNGGDEDDTTGDDDEYTPTEFKLPPHEYGKQLSIYHSNRAACSLHLGRYDDAEKDCNVSILLNPNYTKALIRRMTAYEKTERTDEALKDAIAAQKIDPNNRDIQSHVIRLQKIEDERMEKLKEETMGKLKELGNSILGNFGMSLDNFKADKDPKTGSYNLSFQS